MTLKMYEITDFPSFYNKVKSQQLPFKTSYRLAMLAQEVEKHVNYYQEHFRELLNTYGKKDEEGALVPTSDGQGVLLAEETMDEAYAKLGELRELEVTLPSLGLTDEDFNGIELSPEETIVIIPFLKN